MVLIHLLCGTSLSLPDSELLPDPLDCPADVFVASLGRLAAEGSVACDWTSCVREIKHYT